MLGKRSSGSSLCRSSLHIAVSAPMQVWRRVTNNLSVSIEEVVKSWRVPSIQLKDKDTSASSTCPTNSATRSTKSTLSSTTATSTFPQQAKSATSLYLASTFSEHVATFTKKLSRCCTSVTSSNSGLLAYQSRQILPKHFPRWVSPIARGSVPWNSYSSLLSCCP